MGKTQPRPRFPKDYKVDIRTLSGGRYGTKEMGEVFSDENTFEHSLMSMGQSSMTLSELHPEIIPRDIALEIKEKSTLKYVNADRIRYWEKETGHDVIGLIKATEEVLSPRARNYVNLFRASADTTQTAKAMQYKKALKIVVDTVENLRDITLEKAVEWIKTPYMVLSHRIDALPTVAGRPFAFYAETLQSDLEWIKQVYNNSIIAKWGDATGDHHSAKASGVDGIKLQEKYCEELGVGYMIAPAQVPALEFEADIVFSLARTGVTIDNISRFIQEGKGSDPDVFNDVTPKKRKGSSSMPHKDAKGGNPTSEEQNMSLANYTMGMMTTALANCQMSYARDLSASANMRLLMEDGFKFFDHAVRRLSKTVFYTDIDKIRSEERVKRSYGVITSENVMTHLTNPEKVENPMPRSQAHDLVGEYATEAWNNKTPFVEVLLKKDEITSRIDEGTLREITDPLKFLGESERIVRTVYKKYHRKKTLKPTTSA